MKIKYFCLSLFTLASCSQNEMIEQLESQIQEEEVKGIVMKGSDYLLDTQATRSGIILEQHTQELPSLNFVWKDGDKVGIFPMASNDGSTILNEGTQVAFPMKGGTGTGSANFDGGGWAMKSNYSYAAYYPLINKLLDVNKKKIPVSYANPNFKGILTDESGKPFIDFGESDFMTAEVTTADERGNISFKYSHVGAVIILHCEASAVPSKITKFTITGEDPTTNAPVEFILNGYVDLTQKHEIIDPKFNIKASTFIPGDQPGDKTNTLEVKIDENFKPKKKFEVYFTMAPNQKLKDKKITVELKYIPTDGGEEQTDLISFVVNKDVLAGKAYNWNKAPEDQFTVEQAGTLASLVGSNYEKTSLIVEGNINGEDFNFIQSLTNLKTLNLNKANIVDGNNPTSKSNHIGKGQLDKLSELTTLTLPLSATSIDTDAFVGLTNAANCDLLVGSSIASNIEVTDEGTMTLGGAQFKSIKYLDETGKNQDLYSIDTANHTITSNVPGFISASVVAKAMGDGKELIIKGDLNGRDIKSIREAAGCMFEASDNNPNLANAPLQHLDLSGARIKASKHVYSTRENGKTHHYTKDNRIGEWMFYGSNLHSVILPEGITDIELFAFGSNKSLSSVNIPNTVKTIRNGVWQDNHALTSIVIPNSVNRLGSGVFANCKKLSYVKISENVDFIESQLFRSCVNLRNLELPKKTKWIHAWAFSYSGIETLVIPAEVKDVGEGILKGMVSLTKLTIEGVKMDTKTLGNGFKDYKNSKICNLVLPSFYKDEVTTNSEGKTEFGNLPWKSVTFIDNCSGMGFDDVKDEDAF